VPPSAPPPPTPSSPRRQQPPSPSFPPRYPGCADVAEGRQDVTVPLDSFLSTDPCRQLSDAECGSSFYFVIKSGVLPSPQVTLCELRRSGIRAESDGCFSGVTSRCFEPPAPPWAPPRLPGPPRPPWTPPSALNVASLAAAVGRQSSRPMATSQGESIGESQGQVVGQAHPNTLRHKQATASAQGQEQGLGAALLGTSTAVAIPLLLLCGYVVVRHPLCCQCRKRARISSRGSGAFDRPSRQIHVWRDKRCVDGREENASCGRMRVTYWV